MTVDRIGYGAGTRNPKDFPNVLRLSIGETADVKDTEAVTVIETALDDLTPQVLAHVAEQALVQRRAGRDADASGHEEGPSRNAADRAL